MADQAAETDEDWSLVVERRPRANSNASNASAASDEPSSLTKAALRNERRRRRRAAAAAAAAETPQATTKETPADVEAAAKAQLRGVEKRLKSIRGLAAKETLDDAERKKLARRDDLEAARAALTAVLAGFAAKRAAADAVMGQLDDVQFDDAYECACCREVLELPVKLPCAHEFCRECVALVASRASRPADVVCPLCRAPFYDGAKCRVAVAEKTRRKLKRATGRCHCGATLPLAGLRDHLRACGAAAVYFAPRSKLGHELCPAPTFYSEGAHAPLASSPAASSPLEDALLRRFRHVAPERPPPAPEPVPESTPEPRRRRQRWRRLEATPEPEVDAMPSTPEAPRPAWGAAPAAAPATDLRSLLAAAQTPPPRAPKRAPRATAASPVSLAAFLRGPKTPAPAPAAEAPWLRKSAAPRERPSPASVADIIKEERAAKGTWAGVAR
jgi:rubrerythrin